MSALYAFTRRLKGLPDGQLATLDGENCGYMPNHIYVFGDGYGNGQGHGKGHGHGYGDGDVYGDVYGDGVTYHGTGAGNGVGDGTSVSENNFSSANEYN